MIGAGAIRKGLTIIRCWSAGTSRPLSLRGHRSMPARLASSTSAAIASGAIWTERFSHSSRRTDQ